MFTKRHQFSTLTTSNTQREYFFLLCSLRPAPVCLAKTVCAIARLKIIKFLIHVDTRETKATQLLILLKGHEVLARTCSLQFAFILCLPPSAPVTPSAACHTLALSQRFMLHERSDKQTNGPQILQSEWCSPLFVPGPRRASSFSPAPAPPVTATHS